MSKFTNIAAGAALAAAAGSLSAQAQEAPPSPRAPQIWEPLCANVQKPTGGTTRRCIPEAAAQAIQTGRPAEKLMITCVFGDVMYRTTAKQCWDSKIDGPFPGFTGPSLR